MTCIPTSQIWFFVTYVPASSTGSTTTPQTSEIDRLREENGKLKQDVIELNAKLSAVENKLKQINQLSA